MGHFHDISIGVLQITRWYENHRTVVARYGNVLAQLIKFGKPSWSHRFSITQQTTQPYNDLPYFCGIISVVTIKDRVKQLYYPLQDGASQVPSWFIHPIKHSYIYHKQWNSATAISQLNAIERGSHPVRPTIFEVFLRSPGTRHCASSDAFTAASAAS